MKSEKNMEKTLPWNPKCKQDMEPMETSAPARMRCRAHPTNPAFTAYHRGLLSMSSWTFTRAPAPDMSWDRIWSSTAILLLSCPGRKRAVCRAVRPPTLWNLRAQSPTHSFKKYQEIRGCFKLRGGTRHQFRFISHARSTRSARSARWIQVALATAALPQPAAGPQDPRSQRWWRWSIQKSNRCLTSQSSLDRNSRQTRQTRQTWFSWFSWIWTSQSYPGWLKGGEKEALKHGEGYTHPF